MGLFITMLRFLSSVGGYTSKHQDAFILRVYFSIFHNFTKESTCHIYQVVNSSLY